MEHIVNFGFCIDDKKIEEVIEKRAADEVIKEIKQQYTFKILHDSDLSKALIEVIDEYRDDILDRAVAQVVTSIKNSKKYREALADIASKMVY